MKRYAIVRSRHENLSEIVARYLPSNYEVIWSGRVSDWSPTVEVDGRLDDRCVVIQGEDWHGWILDKYVIPRLGSGLMRADEIDLSHPIMKAVPTSEAKP